MSTRLRVVPAVDLDTLAPLPGSVASVDDFVSRSASLLRDYRFPPREVDTVIAILRDARATGELVVSFSQGGVCFVRFRQEEKIAPP
jgi:hypothetical protein